MTIIGLGYPMSKIYRVAMWILCTANGVRGQLELGLSGGLGGTEVKGLRRHERTMNLVSED